MAFFKNRMRTAYRSDYKLELLSEILTDFDAAPWANDLLHIYPAGPSTRARILMRDRGWIEIDRKSGLVRTWGTPGRAVALAKAIALAEGWRIDRLSPAGSFHARTTSSTSRPPASELETWWRQRGYDAVAAEDGVWINVDHGARLQDSGDRVSLYGSLTPDAARALVLKAAEAWGGEAALRGDWTQPDQDALWLEAKRAGVSLHDCSPSSNAKSQWDKEVSATRSRNDTLSLVRASVTPARLVKEAAAGDSDALMSLDPDLRAFVASYLDDEQRIQLARSDLADIVSEIARFRTLGAGERTLVDKHPEIRPPSLNPKPAPPDTNNRPTARGFE